MNVTPLPTLFGGFWDVILAYVFLYPVLMSVVWMIGIGQYSPTQSKTASAFMSIVIGALLLASLPP